MGGNGFRAYWREIHKRTWAATSGFLGLESWGQIVLRTLLAMTVISGLLFLGSEDAAKDEVLARGFIVGLIVALVPLIYIWNFARVPPKLDQERCESIKALSKARASDGELAARAACLSVLAEWGSDILSDRISEDQFGSWLSRKREWAEVAMAYLANKISHSAAVSLKSVTFSTKTNFVYRVSDEHNAELQDLHARIGTVTDLLKRYEQHHSPLNNVAYAAVRTSLLQIKDNAAATYRKKSAN